MSDCKGFEQIQKQIEMCVRSLAWQHVITTQCSEIDFYACYALNGKAFELNENETKDTIYEKAADENVFFIKKMLDEKWLNEEKSDKNDE